MEETSVSADQLLPSAVTVVEDNFVVSVDPVHGSATLGALCGTACEALDGTVAPVPAFQGGFMSTRRLPSDVLSAALAGDSIRIAIHNGLSFDPLHGGGTIVIVIADDATGTPLGQIVLDGDEDVLFPWTTATRMLSLSAGTVTHALRATVTVDVLGGEPAVIDVSETLQMTATVGSLRAGSVTVNVRDRPVRFDERELDFEDLHEDAIDRIVGGSLILAVTNPFGVSLAGAVDIGVTSKGFSIDGSGSSTAAVSYGSPELRAFLGQPNVMFSGSGIANGTAITLEPGQEMTFRPTLDFNLEIGR
jgi:hypothetical protein